jgi:acid phosphatase type 7
LWHTPDEEACWTVRLRKGDAEPWREVPPVPRRITLPGVPSHRVYRAELTGLTPGASFVYQVCRNDKEVFSATGRARKPATEPQRFVVFGDCSADTAGQRAVAYQTFVAQPDYVFIPGDIVYSNGRISEYRAKYFPIYNSDDAGMEKGAPLIRSTLFVAAPGNHDLARRNFGLFPDILAYYYYWAQPLNGPALRDNDSITPPLQGTEDQINSFRASAPDSYPRMANFSFDYGNAHWTVLDSNVYMDWDKPALQEWLTKDLASAKNATWRFVGFHHPGFSSSKTHFTDQWMRALSPVFERGHVDVVFAGHMHNYQRSFPMKVSAKRTQNAAASGPNAHLVDVEWKLDKSYDGKENRKPKGIIYLVTGAGGAHLYNHEQQGDPSTWQEFTTKFIADQNSFTLVDIDGKKFTAKQVGADSKILDQFAIKK